ncbi:hypothetical protein Tco_1048579 [Tanacetum coccineum]
MSPSTKEPSSLSHTSIHQSITEATTITTISPLKSHQSSPIQLRVARLVQEKSEVKKTDHICRCFWLSINSQNQKGTRNPANYHLFHALMEALIADEDAMDKEVAVKVKDHKRKHDSDDEEDDDDDEGPSAGSNQGRSAKRRRPESATSGSAQPPSKDDHQSSKMTFIHKTLIIPSVLDSCFISSTVSEVKRVMILLFIKICAYD